MITILLLLLLLLLLFLTSHFAFVFTPNCPLLITPDQTYLLSVCRCEVFNVPQTPVRKKVDGTEHHTDLLGVEATMAKSTLTIFRFCGPLVKGVLESVGSTVASVASTPAVAEREESIPEKWPSVPQRALGRRAALGATPRRELPWACGQGPAPETREVINMGPGGGTAGGVCSSRRWLLMSLRGTCRQIEHELPDDNPRVHVAFLCMVATPPHPRACHPGTILWCQAGSFHSCVHIRRVKKLLSVRHTDLVSAAAEPFGMKPG
ncbi:hypothetical protein H920_12888 [Fukomys damarensis]|uniref:Secreted protein n=1 Tax=Fukomys damarensis TaxID=885580 RepID=A0A091D411_FUKDA|nr:hypothetical protein H920_12888 [Fukomys damarensis]